MAGDSPNQAQAPGKGKYPHPTRSHFPSSRSAHGFRGPQGSKPVSFPNPNNARRPVKERSLPNPALLPDPPKPRTQSSSSPPGRPRSDLEHQLYHFYLGRCKVLVSPARARVCVERKALRSAEAQMCSDLQSEKLIYASRLSLQRVNSLRACTEGGYNDALNQFGGSLTDNFENPQTARMFVDETLTLLKRLKDKKQGVTEWLLQAPPPELVDFVCSVSRGAGEEGLLRFDSWGWAGTRRRLPCAAACEGTARVFVPGFKGRERGRLHFFRCREAPGTSVVAAAPLLSHSTPSTPRRLGKAPEAQPRASHDVLQTHVSATATRPCSLQ